MKELEDLGILKIDFLGLKNLTILRKTVENIEKKETKKQEKIEEQKEGKSKETEKQKEIQKERGGKAPPKRKIIRL